jgi:nitrate reductase gamma subunit
VTVVLSIIVYLAGFIFLAGCALRIAKYAGAPLHLRWELYPVPHEGSERAKHGGSYFEEPDWWKYRRQRNLSGDLGFMVPEIVFLRGLWEFNRKLWSRSFPFHFGLYLIIGSGGVLGASALFSIWHPVLLAGSLGLAGHAFYKYAGLTGAILAVIGSLGLLIRRITDDDLSNYTAPADLFNLALFATTFGLLLAGYFSRSAQFPGMLALTRDLVTFHSAVSAPALLVAGIVLLAGLTAYIPYTHMSHFIAKYFTYHSVRWDDALKVPGGKLERKLAEYLTYRPTWSATHIGADGVKSWAEIAHENPAKEREK